MSHGEAVLGQQSWTSCGRRSKRSVLVIGRAILSRSPANFFLGKSQLLRQALIGVRGFDRVQILALDIFD